MLKIGLYAANGRMGQAIEDYVSSLPKPATNENFNAQSYSLLKDVSDIKIAYKFIRSEIANGMIHEAILEMFRLSDVVLDFSTPEGTLNLLNCALKLTKDDVKPLVIGTTGFIGEEFQSIVKAADQIPILYSANTTFGATVITYLLNTISKLEKTKEFDINIIDIHHKQKKDSPSGTAIMFQKALQNIPSQIESFRIDNVPGEHQIILSSSEENISIKHTLTSRKELAKGAVKAAVWLKNKPRGLYNMLNVYFDA